MRSLVDKWLHATKETITQLCGSYGDAVLASSGIANGFGKRISARVASGKEHKKIGVLITAKSSEFMLVISCFESYK